MKDVKIISKLEKIPLADLHYPYRGPFTQMQFWMNPVDPMILRHSPAVELLRLIKQHGLHWEVVHQTRFYQELANRFRLGMFGWDEEKIRARVKQHWNIYKKMKDKGYMETICKDNPVIVLRMPLWRTRLSDMTPWLRENEIWDGGARCAAALVLGWKAIPGYWAEDADPRSKNYGATRDMIEDHKEVW